MRAILRNSLRKATKGEEVIRKRVKKDNKIDVGGIKLFIGERCKRDIIESRLYSSE